MPLPKRKKPPSTDVAALADALKDRLNGVMICLSYSWGGLEQVVAQDATELCRLGLKMRVLCLEGTPIHSRLKEAGEVSLLVLPQRPRDFLDFGMRALLHDLVHEGVNLIHTQQTSLLASIVPWVWTEKNLVVLASRHIMNNHNKRGIFHTTIYSRLDGFIVMSQSLRDNVLDTHRLRDRQLKVIHLGLDFEVFDPEIVDAKKQRAIWGANPETVVIGMVGRIDPAKGQATFIKAAASLMREPKFANRLKFIIVGEETLGGETGYLTELKEMVAQFRMEDQVIFAGHQENVAEVMSAFDIFVMPSRQEAFGLVAIEAMAMECPIVISTGGSANEIVGREEFGLLVHPENPYDLQRQLRFLIEKPEERQAMGRRARDHVRKNYDRQMRIQVTLEFYERCLRRRSL